MDVDALDLLDEFHAGYPPGRLLSLLRHPDSAVVKRGAWIAGELGQAATELLPEAARLLDYPSRAVRFAAVDLVFACAGETDGALVAKVMNMICDPDRSIRWKALRFLGHAEASQIDAGVPYLKDGEIARLAIQLRSF